MGGKKEEGSGEIRSAVEIALARLDKGGEASATLTRKQKESLQEIERELKAKMAELEILTQQRMAAADALGDPEKMAQLGEEKAREMSRLRRVAEGKKDKVRRSGPR